MIITAIRTLLFLLFLFEAPGFAQTPPALPNPGQWGIVSCNTLQDVLWRDASGNTVTQVKGGSVNDENYFTAWNSGAYDPSTRKLRVAANGGDSDGADNGIYDFDLPSCLWSRISAPTVNLIPSTSVHSGTWPYLDSAGTYGPAGKSYPQARHTYGGSIAMPGIGTFIAGGVSWHLYEIVNPDIRTAWHATLTGWQGPFDVTTPDYSGSLWGAWDSNGNRVLFQDFSRLYTYIPGQAAGSRVFGIDDGQQPYDSRNRFFSGCFDAARNRLVGAGVLSDGTSVLEGFDGLAHLPTTRVTFLNPAPWPAWTIAPGIICDQIAGKYVVYPNGGQTLYVVDPSTSPWTVTTITGGGIGPGLPAPGYNGTWHRFAHDPTSDVYLVALRVGGPVYAFKPDRGEPPPPPPTTYALTLAKAGTGIGTTSGEGFYVAGATVTLGAMPGTGSSFAGWSPSPCAPTFVMPARALLCTATFTRGKVHK